MVCTLARTVQHVFFQSVVVMSHWNEWGSLRVSPADRTGGSWCFLCILVGVCASVNVFLALFMCVCLMEGKRGWKKCVFHSLQADIFTNCLAVWTYWPLSTWITHFMCVCVCVCFILPCGYSHCLFMSTPVPSCVCVRSTDEIASSPPPPPPLPPPPSSRPPPPNVISLPLGPWQTHQTGRK